MITKRWWVSWWSEYDSETFPFQYWISGYISDETGIASLCSVIDAASEEDVWELVEAHFRDFEVRFISEKPSDWTPGDRFR